MDHPGCPLLQVMILKDMRLEKSMLGVTGLEKEAAMEYCMHFPLKTAADVKAWHEYRSESCESSSVHERSPADNNVKQHLAIRDTGQFSSSDPSPNAHNNYDNNISQDTYVEGPP